ncbi:hypothetical protein ABEG63_05830 [Chryseobacterium sp. C39-AII1]|uniref:hypothetical protein n=1 Tax=Chryseobacterium sp. C39-AII1 TaxID=3080332 RepID=UPI003208E8FD
MRNYKYFFTILIVLFFAVNSTAQEVFFKDNTRKLEMIESSSHTSYPIYYPMQAGNSFLDDITQQGEPLQVLSGNLATASDRFGNNGQALGINGDNGYVLAKGLGYIVGGSFQFSCWFRFTDEVYNGNKEGILFSIRDKQNKNAKALCTIKNKKITISVLRNKLAGGTVMVPVIRMDVPVEKMEETNGFFFFGMTLDRIDGKRTKLFISRPGGVLFSRFYYVDPFEGINYDDNECWMMGKLPSEPFVKAERMDDLIYDSFVRYPVWKPEYMLNNFYIQSPLYEGVSYEIAGNSRGNIGYLGLQSQDNFRYAEKMDQYIIFGSNQSASPFGYNRFMMMKPLDVTGFQFQNMLEGGILQRTNLSNYIFTGRSTNDSYTYERNVDNPYSMLEPLADQFRLKRVGTQGYLQSYNTDDKEWLTFASPPAEKERALFGITAAFKFARGPERNYSGPVQIFSYERNNTVKWGPELNTPIGFKSQNPEFNQAHFDSGKDAYKILTYKAPEANNYVGRAEDRCLMQGDASYLNMLENPTYADVCKFDLLYFKDDANGKPMYIIRNVSGDRIRSYPKSLTRFTWDPQRYEYVGTEFSGLDNSEGTISPTKLWTIKPQIK